MAERPKRTNTLPMP